ncbi:hypothetical protein Ddye_007656 [Dipteronia dyeriana]|uniref:Uncharacterized protein n=1 Tax=Dipteronia dyeriana TaxID=168575 RepID=A0AAE0CSD0_9ROSI|nr:hypothetical protein Ddye_007656 [Dipteronia dyeriana]
MKAWKLFKTLEFTIPLWIVWVKWALTRMETLWNGATYSVVVLLVSGFGVPGVMVMVCCCFYCLGCLCFGVALFCTDASVLVDYCCFCVFCCLCCSVMFCF